MASEKKNLGGRDLRRIAELRECEDFCDRDEYD